MSRTWSCESVVSDHQGKVSIDYQLESWLLNTAHEIELIDDTFSIDPLDTLSKEKTVAMNAGFFSELNEVLFLHVYRTELLKLYLNSSPERRQMLLHYFRRSLFKRMDSSSTTPVDL